jgi:hypothetical protein
MGHLEEHSADLNALPLVWTQGSGFGVEDQ